MTIQTQILSLALLSIVASARASFTDTDWSAMGSGVYGSDFFPGVHAVAFLGNIPCVGGNFTYAGGITANNVAQWNGTNWSSLGSGMNSTVYALTVSSNGTLYAGGNFTNAGGVAANYIAQWNGTNWSSLGSGMNYPVVSALAVSGGTLYAGGDFTTAGGNAANFIAQWDGSNWSALGSGMNNYVQALAVSGGTLFAGGFFTSAGGKPALFVAQWSGNNWSPLVAPIMAETVYALAVSGTNLYVGGNFSNAFGVGANFIAQWNGSNWSALGSGVNSWVFALAASGSKLCAGGLFTAAGTNAATNVAEANLAGVPMPLVIVTGNSSFGISNGLFGFDISGPPGSNVVIQSSPDLRNWTSLRTNQLNTNGLLYFSDSQPLSASNRFYQVILP
jgi:trimeric autotransporter adhesin